jgi:peptidoglycan hydrolase-like protein with peptidoglycan-binding domain
MTAALHPIYYQRQMVTLEEMQRRHNPDMHPTFELQLFRYFRWKAETKGVYMGIGGGKRSYNNPVSTASLNNMSFHQLQLFSSLIKAWSAADIVVAVLDAYGRPTSVHRSPTWGEVEDAYLFDLHAFIKGEAWHLQNTRIRGFRSWVNAGRPDPVVNTSRWPAILGSVTPRPPVPTQPPVPENNNTGKKIEVIVTMKELREGMSGRAVLTLQKAINAAFYDNSDVVPLKEDGQLGDETATVIGNMQVFFGLKRDEICGPKTWTLVLELSQA